MSTLVCARPETGEEKFRRIIQTNPQAFAKKGYLKLENTHVLIASPLRLSDDIAIPVAIKKEVGTIILMTYMSESHGCWRRFGGSPGYVYFKGIDENNQTLDYRIQRLLDRVNREHEPIKIELDDALVSLRDFEIAAFIKRDRTMQVSLFELEVRLQDSMKRQTIDISSGGNVPTRIFEHWKSGRNDNYKYKEHLTVVVQSEDEQTLYTLGLTKSGMFVKSIQKKSDDVTIGGSPFTCVLPDKGWINSPIIDYLSQGLALMEAGLMHVVMKETVLGMHGGPRVRIKGIHSSSSSPFYQFDCALSPVYKLIEEGKLDEAQEFVDSLTQSL